MLADDSPPPAGHSFASRSFAARARAAGTSASRTARQQQAFQVIAVALTGGAFAILHALNLLGSTPLWAILGLLVVGGAVGQVASARWGPGCSRRQLHFRVAVHMATTTAIVYAIGWGPTLALGYLVAVNGDFEISGSDAYWPSLVWGIAGIGAGQVAIAVGIVSTRVSEPLVHGLGALAALGFAFVVYLLGTKTRDVEQGEAELRSTVDELAAAGDAMREFVAIASHELRTPTTVVKGFASTLAGRWELLADKDRRQYLSAIVRSADQLKRLVDDLLTVSRIDASVLETRPERLRVSEVVGQVLDDLSQRSEFGLKITPDLALHADPEHLRRILRNYIENAVRYGAPPFEIEAVRVGDHAELRVRDHGAGLAESFAPRAFEKFARAKGAPGQSQAGTGLGLSIVRGLARAGGGEAWYEPNQPTGACFAVSFPGA